MPVNSGEDAILDPVGRLRHLTELGSSVTVDNNVAVVRYFRSGPQMEKMARTYYSEGQWEQAFILYNKFATLFVEKLPKHPGYSKAPATDRSRVKKLVKSSFEKAMELKEKLKMKYEQEKNDYILQKKTEEEARTKRGNEKTKENKTVDQLAKTTPPTTRDQTRTDSHTTPPQSDSQTLPPPYPGNEPIDKNEQVQNEYQGLESPRIEIEYTGDEEGEEDSWTPRDDNLLLSNSQTCFEEEEEEENGGYQVPSTDTNTDSEHVSLTCTDERLSKVLPDGPPPVLKPPNTLNLHTSEVPQTNTPPVSYLPPPSTPPQQHLSSTGHTPPPPYTSYTPPVYQPPPSHFTPTQQYSPNWGFQGYYQATPQTSDHYYRSQSYPEMRPVARSTGMPVTTPPPIERDKKPTGPPSYDRNLKPHVLTSLGLEGGIRPVILPVDTAGRFQNLASSNTRKDIETCGILSGKLDHNKFCVTHIIVPKQTGKSDSCETLHEEDIFVVQDKYDLITLGWIHTHPSQTSFMSSVDLHTHCSYQLMLEEAIAIVCAPRYSQVGVFTLTQPHGLNYLTKCSGKGFHTHPKEPPLYEDCKHIQYDNSLTIQIVDLR